MTDNNDINLETIVVDDNPDILLKKQIEKKSGEIAAKVKLTKDTFSSLVTNVVSDKIKKIVSLLNQQLAAQKKAILEAEARKAQEEEKRGQVATDENAIDLAFKLEEKLSRATEKDVVISALDRCNAVVTQIDSPRLNMKPQTKSRALIIKRVLAKYCERIGISWKKYRKEEEIAKTKESDGVSWETLFSGVELSSENALDSDTNVSQIENFDTSEAVTIEERERRNLISDIGGELSDIRARLKTFKEDPHLAKRLKIREDSLLLMLSKVINNDSFIVDKDIEKPIREEKTEMQMVIEESVGYKPALSEEEYKKVAQELEAYYQDPTVGERMHDLMFKDILFEMNGEEAANAIDAAERADNVNKLSTGEVKTQAAALDYKKAGAIQAEQLFQRSLEEWAMEQAKLLYDKGNKDRNSDLLRGANQQADLLNRQNIKGLADEQAKQLYEQNSLLSDAEKQASLLHEQNLKKLADDQANLLYEENRLLSGAEKQAGLLHEQNIKGLANEQAKQLYEQNRLSYGAEKQASLLHEQNLKKWADNQANLLYEENRLLSGAEKQAGLLHIQNLKELAYNQASLLYKAEKEQEVSVQPQPQTPQSQVTQPQLTPQLQSQIQQNPEPNVFQPTTVVTTPTSQSTSNYVISNSYGRYGNQISPPKRVKAAYRLVSIIRDCGKPKTDKTDLKTTLTSLRDQLNSIPSNEEENEMGMSRVAA